MPQDSTAMATAPLQNCCPRVPDPDSAAPGTAGITSRKGGKQQKPNPASPRTVIWKDTWAARRLFHKEMAPCGWDETLAEDNGSQDQKRCQTQRGLPELFSEALLKPLVYTKNANRSARMNHPGASQNPKILWRKQVRVHIRLFWPCSEAPSPLSEVNGSTTEKLPEPLENVAIPTLSIPPGQHSEGSGPPKQTMEG